MGRCACCLMAWGMQGMVVCVVTSCVSFEAIPMAGFHFMRALYGLPCIQRSRAFCFASSLLTILISIPCG